MSHAPDLGVCYYPEHWPEQKWADDAQNMAALGLKWVRIGEFAWSRLEPRCGVYDFGWLDGAIDVLGQAGLQIILGTPTATPPRWMLDQYPDMLAVTAQGAPRKFGSRRHYCFSYQPYIEECRKITRVLAQRYGANPHICAWQTDNEYGCHDTVISYSQAALAQFRLWLAAKYKDIAALNMAWGNVFWSMEYRHFDEIDLPNQTVTEPNPAHAMDFRRFSSDQVVEFNRVQTEILRRFCDTPLLHNYMGRVTDFDHFALGDDLDIASWDSYPMGFLEDRSDRSQEFKRDFCRQGDPDFQAFHHDLYRGVGQRRSKHGRWWVMEQQPGPVNWAPYNPAPMTGMVRLWSWEAIAHGAQVVSYFRWRQAPFGQEQMHAGLLNPDGSQAQAWPEITQLADEIKRLGWPSTPKSSSVNSQAPIAIVFDYASCWAWETQPQGQDFDYFRLIFEFYAALRALGQDIDIIPPNVQDFGAARLVFIPGLFAWNENLRNAIERTEAKVIIGPRSGSKNADFQIPPDLPPDLNGLNLRVLAVESLRPDMPSALEQGGAFQIWQESIKESIKENAQQGLLPDAGLRYEGRCCVENRADGQGAVFAQDNLYYLAGWPDRQAANRLFRKFIKEAGLELEIMPEGLRRRDLGRYRIYMNYSAIAQKSSLYDLTIASANIAVVDIDSKTRIL